MCNVAQAMVDKGVKQGLAQGVKQGLAQGVKQGVRQGKFEDICKLMKNMKLTAEQAMFTLEVPENEYSKYAEMLKQSTPKA